MAVQVTLFVPHAEAVVSCGQVQNGLVSCLGFLQGRALVPQCCNGIRSVAAAARTTNDRRATCRCLKTASRSLKSIDFGKAAILPGRCGVRIPFRISPNVDCSRVG
ncbi:hypothetical protein RD792_012151 [Penstemon davidsonii]|uniref:Non-specific lipid-transfer protein n=1 Tax=Penstemon davidsonii TaxID=160366 RepID=A0ABR0CW17_9LAMI|nr:hypothetical protein RD792_012151 [Penstemon davidsonii]